MKRFRKKTLALLLALFVFFSFAIPAFAQNKDRTVRVGYMNHPGFITEQEDGTLTGYGVDLLNEVCKYTKWELEYVYASWADQLEMLRTGELDIVPMAGYSEERAKDFKFSQQSVGNVQCLLVSHKDNDEVYYEDFSHINGKTIGVQRDSECLPMLDAYAEENGFTYELWEWEFFDDAVEALMNGEVDLLATEQLTNQEGVRIVAHIGSAPIYCMVEKNNASLIGAFDDAMNRIFGEDVTFRAGLYQRHYGNSIILRQPNFTREEIEFIESAGEIEIALLSDSQPSAYVDEDGKITGIVPDLLNDIAEQSGLKFHYSFVPIGEKPLIHMQNNPNVLLGGVLAMNPAFQSDDVLISDNFVVGNAALLTNGTSAIELDLHQGFYKIGTLQAFQAMQLYLKEQYPNFTVISNYITVEDGFEALERGEIDLFTYDFNMILHYWGSPRYTDLRIISTTFLEEPQCIVGMNTPENQILRSIVNKCIATIPAERRMEVERFHLSKNTHEATLRDTIYRFRWFVVIGVFAIAVLVAALTYDKRRTERNAEIIRQKNEELAHAVESAERANHAKSEFLSSMSHDIRTPLNAITGITEIALRRETDAEQMRRSLERIRLSSHHLLTLINDILDISKVESGKMSLNIEEFSLVEMSEILIGLTREQALAKKLDLRMHTHHFEQEHLYGDALRVRQICINLITNAIKYTPEGGRVEVDFKQEPIPEMPDKVRMICVVKDNGIGMSKEFQKVMYDSFSRATDSRVNKTAGTGLGLTICQKMIQLMNGTLECESELGKGTTFSASVILDRGRPDEPYKLPPMRVLVADHDPVSTHALSKIFERLGVSADIVNSPEAFYELEATEKTYDAAVIELYAPDNGGLEGVRILRERYGNDFPILLTDIGDMSNVAKEIEALHVTSTMNKPYFFRTVYEAFNEMLNTGKGEETSKGARETKSLEGMRVLAAEDNDMNWEILNELLEMYGVKADRAEDGQVCLDMLAKAEENTYDAVLMDGRMPNMDGLEAIRHIRSDEKIWVRYLPIIAMTADAFSEDIQNYMEAGADAHLAKPIDVNRLLSILYNVLNEYPLSRGGGITLNRMEHR